MFRITKLDFVSDKNKWRVRGTGDDGKKFAVLLHYESFINAHDTVLGQFLLAWWLRRE